MKVILPKINKPAHILETSNLAQIIIINVYKCIKNDLVSKDIGQFWLSGPLREPQQVLDDSQKGQWVHINTFDFLRTD